MSKPRSRYVHITLYSSEKKSKGIPPNSTVAINVTDKTPEEVEELIKNIKLTQRAANKKFRESNPRKPRITAEMRINASKIARTPANSDDPIMAGWDNGTGNTYCLFGASKSGKSTLMMKLYSEYFPKFIKHKRLLTTLFAQNPQIKLYTSAPGAEYIVSCPYMNSNTSTYIDWQRKVNKLNDNKFDFLNMFDDFIDVRYSQIVNNLILTYRNSMMSAIMCLQYTNLLSKAARSNVNNVFLLHMNTDESIEVAVKSYLQSVLRRLGVEDPVKWYREQTTDHEYIYIHPVSGRVYLSRTKESLQL